MAKILDLDQTKNFIFDNQYAKFCINIQIFNKFFTKKMLYSNPQNGNNSIQSVSTNISNVIFDVKGTTSSASISQIAKRIYDISITVT